MQINPWEFINNKLTLYCNVPPSARRTQMTGLHNQRLKIQLKAPAINSKANKALVDYLAKVCRRPKSDISIQRGKNSRQKNLVIRGLSQIPGEIKTLDITG